MMHWIHNRQSAHNHACETRFRIILDWMKSFNRGWIPTGCDERYEAFGAPKIVKGTEIV